MIRASIADASYRTAFTSGTNAAIADLPQSKGGAGEGFGPHDLLEAALATCLTITARMIAVKRGWPLSKVECEVRIDRTDPDAVAFDYVLGLDSELTPAQERELREAVARCPVARTLTGRISIRSSCEE